MNEVKTCVVCGKKIIYENGKTRTKKYCSEECRMKGKAMHSNANQKRSKERRKAEKGMAGIEVGVLDKFLSEARIRNMSYAEYQKEQTLAKLKKGEC